jgi:preprotein translocase subunit YajC
MPDISPLLAQAQPPAPYEMLITMALMMGVFYFVLVLPMRRKQRKLDALIQGLKSGDKVLLSSGIYGTVVAVEADSLRLRVDDNTRLRVAKNAVAGLQPQGTDTDKTEKK